MSEHASLMKGRTVLITGATSGIGKAAAMGLADMGANIVMVGRSSEKLKATREEIVQKTSNEDLETMMFDLSSMGEVRKLAAEYKKRHDKLDVLLNNAGGIMGERMLTVDGYEYTFALNHLCPFVLTDQLLDTLKATARSRIVTVSSTANRMGHINFDDIMYEKNWRPLKVYSQAKLANVLFTYELSRRLEGSGTTANCLHPGVVRTGFGTKQKGLSKIGTTVIRPFSIGPQKGARTSIFLASSQLVEGVSGRYFVREKEKRSAPESYDEAIAKRLWELSEKLTNVN